MVTFSRLGGSFPTCPSTARRLTTVYFNPSMSAAAVPIAARALRTALKQGGLGIANDAAKAAKFVAEAARGNLRRSSLKAFFDLAQDATAQLVNNLTERPVDAGFFRLGDARDRLSRHCNGVTGSSVPSGERMYSVPRDMTSHAL